MTTVQAFWFAAGALAILALLFVAYPWLSGQSRTQLLALLPRWVPIVGVIAVLAVLGLYLKLGSPQLAVAEATPVVAAAPAGSMSGPMVGATGGPMGGAMGGGAPADANKAAGSMGSAVARLERRLAGGGGSDGDWDLLAKSYEFMGRAADAAAARQKRLPAGAGTDTGADLSAAVAALPAAAGAAAPAPAPAKISAAAQKLLDEADTARRKRDFPSARAAYAKLAARNEMTADAWADYADVTATLAGNKLAGEPEKYVRSALQMNPQQPKALWLQASAQHETKQYAAAVSTWQKLATVLGPASEDARLIAANMAEDQRLAGGGVPGAGGAPPVAAAAAPAPGGVAVRGEVVLADALRGKVPAGLTLFIVAKSVNSPGPPVAILRTTTGSWPVQFQLDDSQAMLPMRKLSTAGPVTIEARTSRSGQAMPEPGDFQGVTAQLDPAAGKPVRIVIQRVIG
jgi:cytochrome c-type biogenesis protein CcmH